MDLNTISERIKELFKIHLNQQFDIKDTIYSNNVPVNYGIVKGRANALKFLVLLSKICFSC